MKYLVSAGLNRISINYYGTDGLLRGCVNDVINVRDFFQPNDYIMLLNEEATVGNFVSAVREYSKVAQAGDTVILNYSGHGTQVTSTKESDKLAEAFCFYDKILLDKQFSNLVAEFKEGVNVIAFVDSCHSGGISRLPNPTDKYKPKAITLSYNSRDVNTLKPIKCSYLGLLACGEQQVAMDGTQNGLFTETMLSNYKNQDFITWLKESGKKVTAQTFTYKTYGKKADWKKIKL